MTDLPLSNPITTPLAPSPPPSIRVATPDEFLPPLGQWTILGGFVMLGGFLGAILLAAILPYSVVVKAPVVVRPTGEVRLVQSGAEGTIKTIQVRINQQVQLGDLLATLEDTQWQSQKQQRLATITSNKHQLRQINAEITALDQQIAAEQAQQQRAIAAAQADLQLAQRAYDNAVATTQADLQEAQAALKLAQDELARYQSLANVGAVSELQIQEKIAAVAIAAARIDKAQAALNPSHAEIARATARMAQGQFQGEATLARLRQDQQERLRQSQEIANQLSQERHALEQLEQTLTKTAIRAPITGTILTLNLRNVNQVVRLGDEIAQIAPANDTITPKALVPSQDINKVEIGQRVKARIAACPYPDFGTLPGSVTAISPDVITNPGIGDHPASSLQSQTSGTYAITITPTQLQLSHGDQKCIIQTGLEGQADIISRQESVLRFVLRKARLWVN